MSEDFAKGVRLNELEIKLAYQENTIEELGQELINQKREIDQLTHQISQLNARLSQFINNNYSNEDNEGKTSITHEIPPHF